MFNVHTEIVVSIYNFYEPESPLCTYSFLLISNKFCDLSLLHWPLLRPEWRCGGGGECGKKNLLHWALEARYDTAL